MRKNGNNAEKKGLTLAQLLATEPNISSRGQRYQRRSVIKRMVQECQNAGVIDMIDLTISETEEPRPSSSSFSQKRRLQEQKPDPNIEDETSSSSVLTVVDGNNTPKRRNFSSRNYEEYRDNGRTTDPCMNRDVRPQLLLPFLLSPSYRIYPSGFVDHDRNERVWIRTHMPPAMKLAWRFSPENTAFVLGFGNLIIYEYLKRSKGQPVKNALSKTEKLFDLAENVPCFLTFSFGIVFQLGNKPWEMEDYMSPLVSGLTIPQVEGMTVSTFEFTEKTNQEYGKGSGVDETNCLEILGIPEYYLANVRAILIFFTKDINAKGNPLGALLSAVFQVVRRNPKIAIAGGQHKENIYFKRETSHFRRESEPLAFGVVLSGDASVVMAASVTLPGPRIKNALAVKKLFDGNEAIHLPTEKLQKMRDFFGNGRRSFAVQLSSCERGYKMNKTFHREASLFKQFFPNTSLVGGFNKGVISHEFHPWGKDEGKYKIPENEDQLSPMYTTTFLTVFHA